MIKLRPGDYTSIKNLTHAQIAAIRRAFVFAGANYIPELLVSQKSVQNIGWTDSGNLAVYYILDNYGPQESRRRIAPRDLLGLLVPPSPGQYIRADEFTHLEYALVLTYFKNITPCLPSYESARRLGFLGVSSYNGKACVARYPRMAGFTKRLTRGALL